MLRRSSALRLGPGFAGRKPTNRNGPSEMPDAERAVTAAFGPGIGTTLNPAARAFLTTVAPGSEIAGVPASVTSATVLPRASCPTIQSAARCSLCPCTAISFPCMRWRPSRRAVFAGSSRRSGRVGGPDAQPESILADGGAAVQRGGAVMVARLTRAGVRGVAQPGRVGVVTLALNVTEGDSPVPPRLYTFGL